MKPQYAPQCDGSTVAEAILRVLDQPYQWSSEAARTRGLHPLKHIQPTPHVDELDAARRILAMTARRFVVPLTHRPEEVQTAEDARQMCATAARLVGDLAAAHRWVPNPRIQAKGDQLLSQFVERVAAILTTGEDLTTRPSRA